MNRKQFIRLSSSFAAMSVVGGDLTAGQLATDLFQKRKHPFLNAYYFRAHMYTMVPSQVRQDMQWMADLGTKVVSVAVLEQDLWAAVENIEIIANEASRLGMDIHIVPSRWGGLVAGAPKVPSLFSVQNPDTWMIESNGDPYHSKNSGVISSVFSEKTLSFVVDSMLKAMDLWDIKGVIWDEPKTFNKIDYSKNAVARLGHVPDRKETITANAAFYSAVNKALKEKNADFTTSLFLPADKDEDIIAGAAQITNLDYFGCDGRPWAPEDGGKLESSGKVLLKNGERFIPAARQNGKGTLWLMENHNMLDKDADLMDKRLPEVLSKDIDQYIYYYYPRNLETPDFIMNVLKKHLQNFN